MTLDQLLARRSDLIPSAPRRSAQATFEHTLACELIVYGAEERRNEHPVVAAGRAALREAGVS